MNNSGDPAIVILAGGVSSRMKSSAMAAGDPGDSLVREAREKSKSLIGVGPGGRPFLDYLLHNVCEAGYSEIVLVVGEKDEEIRARYSGAEGGNPFRGVSISFAVQPVPRGRSKPLGTADALLCALRARTGWRRRKFTVCNSDNLYSRAVLGQLLGTAYAGACIDYDRDALRFEQSRIEQFAVMEKDAAGFLTGIIEKPSPLDIARIRDASGRVGVSMNVWRFTYEMIIGFLEDVPLHPIRGEKELPVAVGLMIKKHPRSMMTIPASEYVPDLTSMGDIATVRQYLRGIEP